MADAAGTLDTFPKLLMHHALVRGARPAIREKDLGIWQTWTWKEFADEVRFVACGLAGLGLTRGEHFALVGDNRPRFYATMAAAQCLGAIPVPLYQDAVATEMAFPIQNASIEFAFAEDQEQVDKLLEILPQCPTLKKICFDDPKGLRHYAQPELVPYDRLLEAGRENYRRDPAFLETEIAKGSGGDTAAMFFTSGTTGVPKGVVHTHASLLVPARTAAELEGLGQNDVILAYLPPAWIGQNIFSCAQAFVTGYCIACPEASETVMADMREIGPTFVLFAPRVWEQIAADVRARIMEASPFKRLAYRAGMSLGMAALDKGRRSRLADVMLFNALRDRLGFSRLSSAATGGAALGPETFRFFQALGVPLRQLYGQTELLGAYTIHRPGEVDYETVGTPFDGVDVAIQEPDPSGLGEIVCRHADMFHGYYGDEAETRAALNAEGWMSTGDAGYFDARGHLVVVDRVRDLATTSRGTRFSPQYVENKLKFSPFIAEVVILGAGRPYLAALICIRFSIVSRWAEKQRIAFTTYTDLSARPQVYELVRHEIEKINESLPEAQRIRKFLLLYKELDADDGELTRTRKLRRSVIGEKYASIIEALYAGASEIDVDAMVAFQDGSKQRIRTRLKTVDLETSMERR